MVALIGAVGGFHLPQQRVHLRQGQAAAGVNGRAAGQCPEKPVRRRIEMVQSILAGEILDDGFDDIRHALVAEERRDAPQRERARADGVDLEARLLPELRVLENGLELVGLDRHDQRLEQQLRCRRPGTASRSHRVRAWNIQQVRPGRAAGWPA